jgi:hypothetical protein
MQTNRTNGFLGSINLGYSITAAHPPGARPTLGAIGKELPLEQAGMTNCQLQHLLRILRQPGHKRVARGPQALTLRSGAAEGAGERGVGQRALLPLQIVSHGVLDRDISAFN